MTDMTIEEELSITCEQRDALEIECARLENEVEALRKDAARYRFLIGSDWGISTGHRELYPEDFNKAIDAAMNGANARVNPDRNGLGLNALLGRKHSTRNEHEDD